MFFLTCPRLTRHTRGAQARRALARTLSYVACTASFAGCADQATDAIGDTVGADGGSTSGVEAGAPAHSSSATLSAGTAAPTTGASSTHGQPSANPTSAE